MSISNQKALLRDFAEKNGLLDYEFYVDDGYRGRNFNRPSFQRMIADIEAGSYIEIYELRSVSDTEDDVRRFIGEIREYASITELDETILNIHGLLRYVTWYDKAGGENHERKANQHRRSSKDFRAYDTDVTAL